MNVFRCLIVLQLLWICDSSLHGADAITADPAWVRYMLESKASAEQQSPGEYEEIHRTLPPLTAAGAGAVVRQVLTTALNERRFSADTGPDLSRVFPMIHTYHLAEGADLAARFLDTVLALPLKDTDGYIAGRTTLSEWVGQLVVMAPQAQHVQALARQLLAYSLPEAHQYPGASWPDFEEFILDSRRTTAWLWIIDDRMLRTELSAWATKNTAELARRYPPKEPKQLWDESVMDQESLGRAGACDAIINSVWLWEHWDLTRQELQASAPDLRPRLLMRLLIRTWLNSFAVPPEDWLDGQLFDVPAAQRRELFFSLFADCLREVPVVQRHSSTYSESRANAYEAAIVYMARTGITPTASQLQQWKAIATSPTE